MTLLDIGETVREHRLARGMTQAELSALSGVSRVRIIHLERGDVHDMTFSNVARILECLDLSIRVGAVNAGRPILEDLQNQKDDLYDTPGLG